jgi:thymidine phosphorylase
MNGIMNKNVDDWFVGLFLAIIYAKGISDDDIYNMTLAMRDTGKIHDYRDIFIPKKLIRRYPTGALSEKTALLLPAMLQAASNDYPLCSAFTIGKSLSFTGGTWSKLGVINGFTFPKPGDETITTLHMCNIAMTVAQDSLCPVDTILYQIRGYTDTVNSVPLAASSIASKQLACPATLLLLDVRYGNGAFFEKTFADQLCLKIKTILAREGLDMISSMLPTDQPNGSSIGNHIEVCEAIAIMKNDEKHFNKEGLSEQKEILINFFAKLMSTTFPKKNENEWRNYGQTLIENYCLLSSFSSICKAHGVAENEIESLFNSPFDYFKLRKIGEIRSDTCGEFVDINQKRLGNISNFIFSNSAGVNSDPNNCLNFNLKMRCGSIVKKNDLLCTIYSNNDVELSGEEINEIYSIFSISN